ncbi:hypothetical protein TNCT_656341 [Trichonephila clavata]|uniref:Uncharacterized protein n=1 Tax=Trichonephila clavata TaxID=2740835 RepID=A0A8X6FG86_TRICU|nr:hypothetical protein TNCT_656341 [Trichonephila clavata]
MNPIKINVDEVIEALLKSEESAPMIQKIEKGVNNEGSDQEEAPKQLVPVRREFFYKLDVDKDPFLLYPQETNILNLTCVCRQSTMRQYQCLIKHPLPF